MDWHMNFGNNNDGDFFNFGDNSDGDFFKTHFIKDMKIKYLE